jgi:SNF2 family DNA or RNA helicase
LKHLSLAQNHERITLVIPDQTPLRAAAKAIRGHRFEGSNDGHAVFSFPAAPDIVALVISSFDPVISPSSGDAIRALLAQEQTLTEAAEAKGADSSLGKFDPGLRTDPMAHQIAAMNFAMARASGGARGTGLLMEQGTGKSLVAIGVANALRARGAVSWAMVISPNSLKGTWVEEITKHSEPMAAISVPRGTRAARLDQARTAVLAGKAGLPAWIITNYENFALNPRGNKAHRDLFDGWAEIPDTLPGVLIVDESTMVKNVRAKRTQAIRELAARFGYVLILTGTPVTASPLDVYGQFEVMDPGALGFHSFLAFDRAYALRRRRRTRNATFEEVVGYQNLEDLEARVAKLSYRARAMECLDLPPVVTKRIPVTLTGEQARIIEDLKHEMMAELDSGDVVDGRNILTRYLRMAQTIGGFVGVLDEAGRATEQARTLTPNPKLDALMEYADLLFDDPTQKMVVFAQYRAEIEAIRDAARERKWKPVAFYGGTPDAEREDGRVRFREDPDTRLFIAQYQTGSKGLTLVEAATVAFYSLTFSLEDFLQARKRVHRIGQTQTVTETFFVGQIAGRRGPRQTLDHLVIEALRRKQGFADQITGDHRRMLEALA